MENNQRVRGRITPLGLNNSTPDLLVEDGALEVCDNLRFANGAWRNVQEFSTKDIPDILKDRMIVYMHPADGSNNYITLSKALLSEEKVTYYGMRSQNKAQASKAVVGDPVVPPSLPSTTNTIVTALTSYTTQYYLNAPLKEASINPLSVKLYDKDLNLLGTVYRYSNQQLDYIADGSAKEDGFYSLFSAGVIYSKLGVTYSEKFYFISDELSEEYGHSAVFLKSGEDFKFFGNIIQCDYDTKTYVIKERYRYRNRLHHHRTHKREL